MRGEVCRDRSTSILAECTSLSPGAQGVAGMGFEPANRSAGESRTVLFESAVDSCPWSWPGRRWPPRLPRLAASSAAPSWLRRMDVQLDSDEIRAQRVIETNTKNQESPRDHSSPLKKRCCGAPRRKTCRRCWCSPSPVPPRYFAMSTAAWRGSMAWYSAWADGMDSSRIGIWRAR